MGSRLVVPACFTLLLAAGPSAAQQFELGAGISRSCRGTEGSICGTDTGVPVAVHASVLFGGRIELGIRAAQGGLEDRMFTTTSGRFDPGAADDVQVRIEGRSIRYFTGQANYHFRRSHRVRPMLGFGVGTFVLPRTTRCEPISCESLQSFGLDAAARPHLDTVAIFGLAAQATPRTVARVYAFGDTTRPRAHRRQPDSHFTRGNRGSASAGGPCRGCYTDAHETYESCA